MNIVNVIIKWIFSIWPRKKTAEAIERQLSKTDQILDALGEQYIDSKESKLIRRKIQANDKALSQYRIHRKSTFYSKIMDHHEILTELDALIQAGNRAYMDRELERTRDILSNVDGKSLDRQQREVVVCDDNRCLCVAGGGSGKTLAIVGKVKYLCEEKNVKPSEILLISFTNKSAKEMTDRIEKMGISIHGSTFHKLGLDIISREQGKRPDVENNLAVFLREYFAKGCLTDPGMVHNLVEFFAYYLHIPSDLKNFSTLGDAIDAEKGKNLETLRSIYNRAFVAGHQQGSVYTNPGDRLNYRCESVKSLEELQIANFLFLHGIAYEYERPYPVQGFEYREKSYRPAFYLPQYELYLEHFTVNCDNTMPWLSPIEEEKYRREIKRRRAYHQKNGTKLIETYSWYTSKGILLKELDRLLQENGVQYQVVQYQDVFNAIYSVSRNEYFSEFILLCSTFIALLKSNGEDATSLKQLCWNSASKINRNQMHRNLIFCDIMKPILDAYQKYLAAKNAVDFSDMINTAAEYVRKGTEIGPYRWIIIDEFQDISNSRCRLIQEILKRTGAKLLCVGDDWQSIFRFAGSDLSIFTEFEKKFGPYTVMRLERTYRNSQELIDAAGEFVMRNDQQLRKNLKSGKSLIKPIVFTGFRDQPFLILKRTVDRIIQDAGPNASIMFLGRGNHDADILRKSGMFRVDPDGTCIYRDSPQTPMKFYTIHKSKGLEADNVMVLNFRNGLMGFPNKIADDPVLDMVLSSREQYPYAEERRLFYVALTRTRNKIYILFDENRPSEFLKEFDHSLSVRMDCSGQKKEEEIVCPHCRTGHLVRHTNRRTNREFVSCSNYPRCGYTINDASVLTNPYRCPVCRGFLLRHITKDGHVFYGCSNYPVCTYTKNNVP